MEVYKEIQNKIVKKPKTKLKVKKEPEKIEENTETVKQEEASKQEKSVSNLPNF